MSTVECTRRIEFDAAHRVVEHEGKCKHLHGHRYVLEASFSANSLDSLGRVVDFGRVKEVLGGWIDANWDHTTILYEADKALGAAITEHTGQKIYYMPYNPTAENMASYLLENICPRLFATETTETTANAVIACTRVRLWETPNCYADAVI